MFHRSTKAVVQGRHILRRTTKNIPENSRSRRWPLLLGLGAAALLLVLAGLALFWYREDTAPALEGRQLLAIPAESSLAQETPVTCSGSTPVRRKSPRCAMSR